MSCCCCVAVVAMVDPVSDGLKLLERAFGLRAKSHAIPITLSSLPGLLVTDLIPD